MYDIIFLSSAFALSVSQSTSSTPKIITSTSYVAIISLAIDCLYPTSSPIISLATDCLYPTISPIHCVLLLVQESPHNHW